MLISSVVAVDLWTDTSQGAPVWHVWVEGTAGVRALVGALYLLRQMFLLRGALRHQQLATEA